MPYREVEVEVMVGDKVEPYTFNIENINYYRVFTDNSGQCKTMIYLKGSLKGIVLNIGYDVLKTKLQRCTQTTNNEEKATHIV